MEPFRLEKSRIEMVVEYVEFRDGILGISEVEFGGERAELRMTGIQTRKFESHR